MFTLPVKLYTSQDLDVDEKQKSIELNQIQQQASNSKQSIGLV